MHVVGVTGSNGFVGRHLCRLLEGRGHAVRRIVRRNVPPDEAGSRVVVVANMADSNAWTPALEGVDTLIHLIGHTHVGSIDAADLLLFRSVNVGITRALAQAAQNAGIGHLLYLSSIKVCGEGGPVAYTEVSPAHPQDVYGQTKLEAEELLRGLEGKLGITVIRPPMIYGPGVGGNMARLIRAVCRGTPLPLGLARRPRSLLYVGNLVDALEISMRRPPAQDENRLYHVADAYPVCSAQLISIIANVLGTSPRLLPVPLAALRLAARAIGQAEQLEKLTAPLVIDSSKFCYEFGWSPPHSTFAGLEDTVAALSAGAAPKSAS